MNFSGLVVNVDFKTGEKRDYLERIELYFKK